MSSSDDARVSSARTPSKVRADIADLERLLVDVPPHHASGTRRSLDEQLEDLRAELRRLEGRA
jgi:molybdate-binding protein